MVSLYELLHKSHIKQQRLEGDPNAVLIRVVYLHIYVYIYMYPSDLKHQRSPRGKCGIQGKPFFCRCKNQPKHKMFLIIPRESLLFERPGLEETCLLQSKTLGLCKANAGKHISLGKMFPEKSQGQLFRQSAVLGVCLYSIHV